MKTKKLITKPTKRPRTVVQNWEAVVFSIALIAIAPFSVNAASFQSPETLRSTALAFLEQQTTLQHNHDSEITIGRVDRRLRLSECVTPPTAFLAPGSKLQGKLSVGLRCTGKKPWTVYVPAQIKRFAKIITAAHSLPRGTQISDSDLLAIRQDISQLRGGYFTKNENIVGKILRRSMNVGQVFSAKNVKPPLLVRRGDEVVIFASMGGLQVRVKGKALKDAALGERVPVRNKQSKRIVQGTAVKPGTVSVQM